MDIVFNLRGHTYYIDTAVVTPFFSTQDSSPQPEPAQATWPNVKKRKSSTDTPAPTWSPFILETTGRSGYHAPKFIKHLYSDADHPPTAIRDAWAAIETTLHNSISKQQLRAVTT